MVHNLISIPLRIEDPNKKLIKNSDLFLRINGDENDNKRVITGMVPEGTYRAVIDEEQWHKGKTLTYNSDKWRRQMNKLLPLDVIGDKEEQSERAEQAEEDEKEEDEELQLTGKLIMNPDSYEQGELKEDFEMVNEELILSVKTKGETLSKTYGTFQMRQLDEAIDLFDWMKNLIDIKDRLAKEMVKDKRTIKESQQEITQYQKCIDETEKHHTEIIQDLSIGFQHILATKKEKILSLMSQTTEFKVNEWYNEKNKNSLSNIKLDDNKLEQLPQELPDRLRKRKGRGQSGRTRKKQKGSKDEDNEHEEHEENEEEDYESNEDEDTDEDNGLLKMSDRDMINTVTNNHEEEQQSQTQQQDTSDQKPPVKQESDQTDVSDSDMEYIKQEVPSDEDEMNVNHQTDKTTPHDVKTNKLDNHASSNPETFTDISESESET